MTVKAKKRDMQFYMIQKNKVTRTIGLISHGLLIVIMIEKKLISLKFFKFALHAPINNLLWVTKISGT